MQATYNIAVVDDHTLIRSALKQLISSVKHNVTVEAENGAVLKEILKNLDSDSMPDLIILDINMPIMNGQETVSFLKKLYPDIKILILTMRCDDQIIIDMVRKGVDGYLLKSADPEQLIQAIEVILNNGNYFSPEVSKVISKLLDPDSEPDEAMLLQKAWYSLTIKEKRFVELACSDKTYSEIANEMGVSVKTIDNYRETAFTTFNVNSRLGLVLFILKNKLGNIKL